MMSPELAESILAEEERRRIRKMAEDLELKVPEEWILAQKEGPDRRVYAEGVLEMLGLLRAHYPDLTYAFEPDTLDDGRVVHHLRVRTSKRDVEISVC